MKQRTKEDWLYFIKERCSLTEIGCWEWRGACSGSKSPRPQIRVNCKLYYVTRYLWEQLNGEIPAKLFVCHHCDNAICVNPEHLYLATQKENMKDASRRGRFPGKKSMNDELANKIIGLRWLGLSLKDVSKFTEIPYGTVTTILYSDRW